MQFIQLTRGFITTVDDDLFDELKAARAEYANHQNR